MEPADARRAGDLRKKAFTARNKGAKALIVVDWPVAPAAQKEKWEMPPEAVKLLKPNVKLGRHYESLKDSRKQADLMIVQCKSPNDMSGHYPPNCYPQSGLPLVDTVDGKKLDKPVRILIHNAGKIPAKQRCVFKGYESGSMIGVPPAVFATAREHGRNDVNPSPFPWQWRPYFVALIVVVPKGLEISKKQDYSLNP